MSIICIQELLFCLLHKSLPHLRIQGPIIRAAVFLPQSRGIYLDTLAAVCEQAERVCDNVVKSAYIRIYTYLAHVAQKIGQMSKYIEFSPDAKLVYFLKVAAADGVNVFLAAVTVFDEAEVLGFWKLVH